MDSLKNLFKNFKFDWKFGVIILIVILLISIIFYIYKTQLIDKVNPSYVNNKEFIDNDSIETKNAKVILFSTTWCPHCRSLKNDGIWGEFMEKYDNKVVNGYNISVVEIDCTNDNDPDVKNVLDSYEIEGFPSIKLQKEGVSAENAIDFDAKPEMDSLNQFVSSVL